MASNHTPEDTAGTLRCKVLTLGRLARELGVSIDWAGYGADSVELRLIEALYARVVAIEDRLADIEGIG